MFETNELHAEKYWKSVGLNFFLFSLVVQNKTRPCTVGKKKRAYFSVYLKKSSVFKTQLKKLGKVSSRDLVDNYAAPLLFLCLKTSFWDGSGCLFRLQTLTVTQQKSCLSDPKRNVMSFFSPTQMLQFLTLVRSSHHFHKSRSLQLAVSVTPLVTQ